MNLAGTFRIYHSYSKVECKRVCIESRGVKLIFIQGPHTDQFDLMWAGSLNRWREGRKERRKVGRTDRRKEGQMEETEERTNK